MRNKAKCKLCNWVIESFFYGDNVFCKCGEIAVMDGAALRTWANNYDNFLRVDDEGNGIIVKYETKDSSKENDDAPANPPKELTRNEMIQMLDELIKADENLPEQVQRAPITNYDLLRYMLLISNILKKG
jgi:hypothetical protein